MATIDRRYIDDWWEHIRVLSDEIGPRGSTTPAERAASDYCETQYRALGYRTIRERFRSAVSLFLLQMYVSVSMLLAFLIYPLSGRLSAAIALLIGGVGMYSVMRELMFRDNPLRRLIPRGDSQNVFTTVDPADEHRQDLILIGHVDTNRSPLLFRSSAWIKVFRLVTSITFALFITQGALTFFGLITQWPIVQTLMIPSAIAGIVFFTFMLEGELSPFSPGANDNATSAGILLTLARHFQDAPLRHTRVWLVNTGCEEVKHYGAIDFFQRHTHEFLNPRAIALEMLGRDRVGWVTHEGIVSTFTTKTHPEMIALCESVAEEHPELGGHPTWVGGGQTEQADAARAGIPAVALIGLCEFGTGLNYVGPHIYWHHREDTIDKFDPDLLADNYAFVWHTIRAVDELAEEGAISPAAMPALQGEAVAAD